MNRTMNLADMLTFADITQLTTIASHYECECKPNSKNELIQSILVTLNRKEFISQQIRCLSTDDLRFLNAILFDDRHYFNVEEFIAIISQTNFQVNEPDSLHMQIKKTTPRETIARFKKSGWIFNGRSHDTKYLFSFPHDLKDRFRSELGDYLNSMITYTNEPSVYREEQGLMLEDLGFVLRYIHEQKIELNQNGTMYRRNQQQIMDSLHIHEPLLIKGGWRFGYGRCFHAYPNRLSLIYDYAYHKGYLDETDHKLTLTNLGIERLNQGKREEMEQIVRFWSKTYKSAIPNLPSLLYWIGQCCRDWVTLNTLHEALGWLIKPYYYDTAHSIMEERVIQMMMHLGILRIGKNEEETVVKITVWGQQMV
ncbi:hypothetical protein [Paenibacillus sp. CMAA1364]